MSEQPTTHAAAGNGQRATALEAINTSAINVGDVIHHFGLQLLVDHEVHHATHQYNNRGGIVKTTSARIENWDQVAGYVGNLAHVDEDGTHRWTIQGNDLAIWMREV
ncbi:hypothetical protein ACNQVK_01020 [Mycobacterium sp. 134]|uniref:hypothetical protein n=1 Tax=Mycobacterium sp. 134 TaxID=3400425 RepID=UPI003AAC4032